MALNKEQREKFVDEYLKDLNGTQAAIRAGYSESYAKTHVYKLLESDDIKRLIEQKMAARSARTEVTHDRVLLEIARLAFNDPRKAFGDNGVLLPVKEWPDEVAAAISSIKVTETLSEDGERVQLKEIKFWDKGKQIELAGRHLGMFNDKLKVDGNLALTGIEVNFVKP